jgi:hypothetical protein
MNQITIRLKKSKIQIILCPEAAKSRRSSRVKSSKFVWFNNCGILATNNPVKFKYANGSQFGLIT